MVINPAQVRHYAKARGKWAKTDPIDARLIAGLKDRVHLFEHLDLKRL